MVISSLKCDICLKISTHTSDKPYMRDICLKPFSDKGNLRKHQRTQHGTSPERLRTPRLTGHLVTYVSIDRRGQRRGAHTTRPLLPGR
jgi:hypothetical protein